MRWLLSQKEISGNEKDHTHYTPSHEAAEHGHFRLDSNTMISSHVFNGRDRLVVRTLRCGRNNPGSNPGHGIFSSFFSLSNPLQIHTLEFYLYLFFSFSPLQPTTNIVEFVQVQAVDRANE